MTGLSDLIGKGVRIFLQDGGSRRGTLISEYPLTIMLGEFEVIIPLNTISTIELDNPIRHWPQETAAPQGSPVKVQVKRPRAKASPKICPACRSIMTRRRGLPSICRYCIMKSARIAEARVT